jgi:hypothetical protein
MKKKESFFETTIEKFTNDKSWNTLERDGSRRMTSKIEWIKERVKYYAETLSMSKDKVMEYFEKERNYSWPNYYQENKFPKIDSKTMVGIFDTKKDFFDKYPTFKCPKCGTISEYPSFCIHRKKEDGICNWTAGGLFRGPYSVIIKEIGIVPFAIFEPIEQDIKE